MVTDYGDIDTLIGVGHFRGSKTPSGIDFVSFVKRWSNKVPVSLFKVGAKTLAGFAEKRRHDDVKRVQNEWGSAPSIEALVVSMGKQLENGLDEVAVLGRGGLDSRNLRSMEQERAQEDDSSERSSTVRRKGLRRG